MAYTTKSLTGIDAFWAELKARLTAVGWTVVKEDVSDADKNKHYIYYNSKGTNNSDDIYIGINKRVGGSNREQIQLYLYWQFDSAKLPDQQASRHPTVISVIPHNQATYHFTISKDHAAFLIEQGGFRYFSYIGMLESMSPRSTYTYPYCVIGNTTSTDDLRGKWGGADTNSFPSVKSPTPYYLLDNETTWRTANYLHPYSKNGFQAPSSQLNNPPHAGAGIQKQQYKDAWFNQRGCVDDDATGKASSWMVPILVSYNSRWRGQLKGVFFPAGGDGFTPGDDATFNARSFKIFSTKTELVRQSFWAALEKA